jgi:cell division protein FtsL
MLKLANAFLVVAVLGSGFALYTLEHQIRGQERANAKLNREIDKTHEDIKLFNAEWSSLTRPERIQKLALESLKLEPTKATQFVSTEDLVTKVPAEVPVKLEKKADDPIGDILEKMQ